MAEIEKHVVDEKLAEAALTIPHGFDNGHRYDNDTTRCAASLYPGRYCDRTRDDPIHAREEGPIRPFGAGLARIFERSAEPDPLAEENAALLLRAEEAERLVEMWRNENRITHDALGAEMAELEADIVEWTALYVDAMGRASLAEAETRRVRDEVARLTAEVTQLHRALLDMAIDGEDTP